MTKLTSFVFIAALLAGAGCKKGGGSDAARCAAVAGGAVDRMMARVASGDVPGAMKQAMQEKGDKLKGVITKRCSEDKWPAEVLDCYEKAGSMPEIRSCRQKLSPELAQKLQGEEMAVMMGGNTEMPKIPPEQLQARLKDLDGQIDQLTQQVSNATDDASRMTAKEKLVQLQREQFMLRRQLQDAGGSGAAPVEPPPAGSAAAPAGSAAAPAGSAAAPAGSAAPAKP